LPKKDIRVAKKLNMMLKREKPNFQARTSALSTPSTEGAKQLEEIGDILS